MTNLNCTTTLSTPPWMKTLSSFTSSRSSLHVRREPQVDQCLHLPNFPSGFEDSRYSCHLVTLRHSHVPICTPFFDLQSDTKSDACSSLCLIATTPLCWMTLLFAPPLASCVNVLDFLPGHGPFEPSCPLNSVTLSQARRSGPHIECSQRRRISVPRRWFKKGPWSGVP